MKLADLDTMLCDSRAHSVQFTRPWSVLGPRPDREETPQLLDIARVARRIRHTHDGLATGLIARIFGQVWMDKSRERTVELAQRDVVITVPAHDLAAHFLLSGPTMTPFGPPGSLFRPALFLFPVQLVV